MSDRTVNINKLSNNTLAVPEDASLAVNTVPFIVSDCMCVCVLRTATAKPNKGVVNILQFEKRRDDVMKVSNQQKEANLQDFKVYLSNFTSAKFTLQ